MLFENAYFFPLPKSVGDLPEDYKKTETVASFLELQEDKEIFEKGIATGHQKIHPLCFEIPLYKWVCTPSYCIRWFQLGDSYYCPPPCLLGCQGIKNVRQIELAAACPPGTDATTKA